MLFVIIREAPIDAYDKYGLSPLMQAAQKGYLEYVINYRFTFTVNDWTASPLIAVKVVLTHLNVYFEIRS